MNQQLISFFSQIVSIDSPSGKEKSISDFIMNYLKKIGQKPIRDKKWMIYCRIGQKPNPILFASHLDTVEPGQGIKVALKNGYLCPSGKTILGGDNKISIAAILYNVTRLLNEKKNLNIELLFSVREETNSGIQEFDWKGIVSKVGFVFDLANQNLNSVVLKAPMIFDFKVNILGKEAHASRPEKGINVLDFFLKLGPKIKLGRPDKNTTFNIGLIRGGSATNTIPGRLTLAGDLRSLDKKSFGSHKNHIEKVFKRIADESGVKIDFKWIPYSFAYSISLQDRYLLQLKKIYQGLGLRLKPVISTGGSDAGFLNHKGIKTFCLADGLLATHTVNEKIKVTDFKKLTEIIKTIMLEYKL